MIYGLHPADIAVVIVFFAITIFVGVRVSRSIKNSEGFFIANRKMGKGLQFFLLFGQATDADTAIVVVREVYRQGISGLWLSFRLLFMTPFHWFLAKWHRRMRFVTISDVYMERYRSSFITIFFSAFQIFMSVFTIGLGYVVAYKTIKALTVKPAIEYTVQERESVESYQLMRALEEKRGHSSLSGEETAQLAVLQERDKQDELDSYISYVKPVPFFIVYGLIICIYTLLGGLMAATINDIFQSLLILVFSLILIPYGLMHVGGFSGLHDRVPASLFELFGTHGSEYTWYFVLTLALLNLIGTLQSAPNATVSSAARTEFDAQFGMITGSFVKRLVMITWAICGLLALAMYGASISDPDTIWGVMTHDLLGPGFVGMMLAGFLAASMSTKSSYSVSYSSLLVKNIYKPFFPDKSESHYVLMGRIAICIYLFSGIIVALTFNSVLAIMKIGFAFTGIFSAPIWLGLFWRRATRRAVIAEIIICIFLIVVAPFASMAIPLITTHPALLKETEKIEKTEDTFATVADVKAGLAEKPGQRIVKKTVIDPVGIYFEKVVRVNPNDPASSKEGRGEFYIQVAILELLGMDFSKGTKADIETARFLFNLVFPFILIMTLSMFMKPEEKKEDLDAFFAKKNTPVDADPEKDARALKESTADFGRFNSKKLFPNTQWEMLKPEKRDIIGFGLCWVLVGCIFLVLWGVVKLQWP
ncbi:MAG: hypothetical protein A2268_03855 [Candidatus Raymondbacteria bacterium RifOxyA12_full_50_37]|uniref:Transporter n=1 Tax=Candidatus Raymondbacteria bacterium RIFOXYD12_FULL_49_13 TaxID=1817890 RepID=A0A1F7FAW1_UNCRA|nr:MAG: hypothetical protein A2268_03855 [Candidatus Raymondbacteria bacterium RifOxyA12_full_50_37]OGJ92196.1 MAG: hypothetical protein A2350_14860 [Candidatus Raymondbacteria bacterium RifOxyB12_full_50_8]OGJ92641.1 MAG: hypothetical protein A2248_06095 [Candidatus Raymondbacteria bacterium RIFOXYA2_FULL_49_16]OGJ97995.1 MAG: hypothetical protein A2453_03120 [Candidatus Raymondbacteria bacterium RIFOXYC2_FULL_50_21]OGJ99859.1 MAG: hypothetical protein A2487_10920 [Candidatus Raymondbacteria b